MLHVFIVNPASGKNRGFKLDPKAKLNTWKLDVIEVASIGKFKILKILMKLSKGRHIESDFIDFRKVNNIRVDSSLPLLCNVDGEIIKDTSFNFSIEKESIRYMEDHIGVSEYLKQKKLI